VSRTAGLLALAALLIGGVALIVVELTQGARTYGEVELHDSCEPRVQFQGEGFEGTLQRIALDGIDGAACSLELGREEFVLAFVPDVAPEEVEWPDEVIVKALRGGFSRAIDEAEGRDTLGGLPADVLRGALDRAPLELLVDGGGGISDALGKAETPIDPGVLGEDIREALLAAIQDAQYDGSLGRVQGFVLRETVERLPVALFTDIGLSIADTLSNEPFPWARETIIDAVRTGIIKTIDEAEENGTLPSLVATPLREIVRRAPVSQLIDVGETIAGLLD
jgi:hypothetical protein